MIEVFGKDGRVFRFQDGTSDEVIKAALDKHYQVQEAATEPAATQAAPLAPELPIAALAEAVAPPPLPPAQPSQPTPPQAQAAPQPTMPPPAYREPQFRYEDAAPPSQAKAMRVTLMVGACALGILAVTGILWATGMIGNKEPNGAVSASKATPASSDTPFTPTVQPDMRQAVVATQMRKEARSDSAVIKEMIAGATVDVLGEQTIAGTPWLRVRVDQVSSNVGYVLASHLGGMGPALTVVPGQPQNGGLAVPPQGAIVTPQPAPAAPPAPTAAAAMPVTTYYVASRQVNVRASASPEAGIVGRMNFSTPLIADAQANYQGRVWLRVRANNGVSGWVNSNLVSLTPASAPIDEPVYAAPPMGRVVGAPPRRQEQLYQEFSSGDDVRIIALNANIRAEPSVRGGNDTVIDVAPMDDILSVRATRVVNGKLWYQVRSSKGITGWISSETVASPF
jgi:SH3-like domain-containing protein